MYTVYMSHIGAYILAACTYTLRLQGGKVHMHAFFFFLLVKPSSQLSKISGHVPPTEDIRRLSLGVSREMLTIRDRVGVPLHLNAPMH